jgi:WD40 repeat protein/serine/threonine protein kinase
MAVELPGDAPTLPPTGGQPADAATLPPGPGDAAPAVRPEVHIPGYEILGELGRGGMGVVYKARDLALGRVVALKMVLAGAHAGSPELARFQAEAQTVARLRHPGIVQIFEVGEHQGLPFFALEYIAGGSLAQRLDGTPLPARTAAALVAEVARAVQYAHEQGIVHRDLKPANILLDFRFSIDDSRWEGQEAGADRAAIENRKSKIENPIGNPKITDFGLAKQLDSAVGATRSGAVMGTPSYMAPEQAGGRVKEVGPAADVYALAAILYELLTGRPPFRAETPLDTILLVLSQEPVPPTQLQPKVPRDLDTICLKCLQKDPRRRYPSAAALADDLERYLRDEPIQARPTAQWERAWKWTRRHPALAVIVFLFAVPIPLLLVLSLLEWRDASAARDVARDRAHEAEVAGGQARAALRESRTNLYFQQIALAEREWLANNVARAEELLDSCPEEFRDWEWRHLKSLCRSDLLAVAGPDVPGAAVAVSPDGRRIALAAVGRDAQVNDARTGEPVFALPGARQAVAFSPDGTLLATPVGNPDVGGSSFRQPQPSPPGEVALWAAATGRRLATLKGHGQKVMCVAFSPDGRLLASGGSDGQVKLWDVAQRKELASLATGLDEVLAVAVASDGRLAASSLRYLNRSGEVRVWDRSGAVVWRHAERWAAPALAFRPDGAELAAAHSDQAVRVHDGRTGRVVQTLRGHTGLVTAAAYSPDGRRLATGSLDRSVRLWDVATGQEEEWLRGHRGAVGGVAFGPDGRWLASAAGQALGENSHPGRQGELRLWDLTRGQRAEEFWGQISFAFAVRFSPDGRELATARAEGSVRLWDATTGRFRRTLPNLTQSFFTPLMDLAYSPDERWLATASMGGVVQIHDLSARPPVRPQVLTGHTGQVLGVAFSPDGRLLASAGGSLGQGTNRGEVRVWDFAKRDLLFTLPGVFRVAFSPDGRWLAAPAADGFVHVWAVADLPAAPRYRLPGHQGGASAVAFSPDSRWLATGAADRTVRLWALDPAPPADGAAPLRTFTGHASPIMDLAFSPDGRRLASASLEHGQMGIGEVKLWDVATGREALSFPGSGSVAFARDGRLAMATGDYFSRTNPLVFAAPDPAADPRAARRAALAEPDPGWHARQAAEARAAGHWAAALFHLDRLLAARPDDRDARAARAGALAALGQWDRAAADFDHVTRSGPAAANLLHQAGLVRLAQGDVAGYRQGCAELLERFVGTTDPSAANSAAWHCCLVPDAVADPSRPLALAELAAGKAPRNYAYLHTRGAALLRAGRTDDALRALAQAAAARPAEFPPVYDWLWLALAQTKKGDLGAARDNFARSAAWLDEPTDKRPGGLSWDQEVEIKLLREEVERALKAPPAGEGRPGPTG